MATEMRYDLSHWRWKYGQPAEFWLVTETHVGEFVKANKLRPVSSEARRPVVHGPTTKMSHERGIDIEEIRDMRGGMRGPHLHYRGETYLLDAKQWKEFSGEIISDFRSCPIITQQPIEIIQ